MNTKETVAVVFVALMLFSKCLCCCNWIQQRSRETRYQPLSQDETWLETEEVETSIVIADDSDGASGNDSDGASGNDSDGASGNDSDGASDKDSEDTYRSVDRAVCSSA